MTTTLPQSCWSADAGADIELKSGEVSLPRRLGLRAVSLSSPALQVAASRS
jgi:hypothetical protein